MTERDREIWREEWAKHRPCNPQSDEHVLEATRAAVFRAIAKAREEERRAVVDYLRHDADNGFQEYYYPLSQAADAIDRGEHVK